MLVNNMGIFEPEPFEESPDADWLWFFETNVISGVRLTRHYLATAAWHAARPCGFLPRRSSRI